MKKIWWVIVAVFLVSGAVCILTLARAKVPLPRPEDMAGKEASPFLPEKVENNKRAAQGSEQLKLTGPVWIKPEPKSKSK